MFWSVLRIPFLAFLLLCWCSFSFLPRLKAPRVDLGESLQSSTVPTSSAAFLQVGEELHYDVSYLFFGLGEIRVKVTERIVKDGEPRYRAEAYIDSYSGNPFINLHQIYESEFDTSLNSRFFQGRWLDEEVWRYVIYRFDYKANKVYVESGKYEPRVLEKSDTIDIHGKFQDGLSLFYYARANVKSGHPAIVPTFINEKKGKTYFNFTNEKTEEGIDSIQYPISVVEFEGEANWVGIFGLTGGFRGWFSDDDARIPIRAKMKVIIGSVKVKLLNWKRNGWSPPQYIENN